MRTMRPLLCLSIFFSAMVLAQAPKSTTPLTNADVIKLVRAGIPDDTIVLAIRHGKTNFDASPDALIQLSKSGVNKSIIDAMLSVQSPVAPARGDIPRRRGMRIGSVDVGGSNSRKPNLSDDFAKAALRALNSIKGSVGQLSFSNGGISVPRQTQEAIDSADAEARTPEEKATVAALNQLHTDRLRNNMTREIIKGGMGMSNPSYSPYQSVREMDANTAAAKHPTIINLNRRESACADALDAMLRARYFSGQPKDCDNVSPTSVDLDAFNMLVDSSNDEGVVLMEKVVSSLGGATRLAEVKAWRATSGQSTVITQYPDHIWMDADTPQGHTTVTFSGTTGYVTAAGKKVQLAGTLLDAMMLQIKCGILSIAQHARNPKYKFFAGAITPAYGERVLDINADGEHVRWYVEPSTGRIGQVTRRELSPQGVLVEASTRYGDWKMVDGINVPFESTVLPSGSTKFVVTRVRNFEINPVIDSKLFDVRDASGGGNATIQR